MNFPSQTKYNWVYHWPLLPPKNWWNRILFISYWLTLRHFVKNSALGPKYTEQEINKCFLLVLNDKRRLSDPRTYFLWYRTQLFIELIHFKHLESSVPTPTNAYPSSENSKSSHQTRLWSSKYCSYQAPLTSQSSFTALVRWHPKGNIKSPNFVFQAELRQRPELADPRISEPPVDRPVQDLEHLRQQPVHRSRQRLVTNWHFLTNWYILSEPCAFCH